MKPIEFYDLGVNLAHGASTEAERRMVIGRIYYGLHHEACCRYFREKPGPPYLQKRGRHTELVDAFKGLKNNAEAQKVGTNLETLKMLREYADYELAGPFWFGGTGYNSASTMGFALGIGQKLLGALESYSPGEAPDGCICVQ